MKNRKAFTLVELIISIAIIVIIGVGSTLVITSSKSNKELETITKSILEAANAYVKIEKEEDGTTYYNKVLTGSKGVGISLKTLADSAYLSSLLFKIKRTQLNSLLAYNSS